MFTKTCATVVNHVNFRQGLNCSGCELAAAAAPRGDAQNTCVHHHLGLVTLDEDLRQAEGCDRAQSSLVEVTLPCVEPPDAHGLVCRTQIWVATSGQVGLVDATRLQGAEDDVVVADGEHIEVQLEASCNLNGTPEEPTADGPCADLEACATIASHVNFRQGLCCSGCELAAAAAPRGDAQNTCVHHHLGLVTL